VNIRGEDDFTIVSRCYFYNAPAADNWANEWRGSPPCNGATELIVELKRTIAQLNVHPKYLVGANEPWQKSDADWVNVPSYVTTVWSAMEIAADILNLTLVTPTTRKGADLDGDPANAGANDVLQEATWHAEFLRTVKTNPTTDIEKVKAVDFHAYSCRGRAEYWTQYFEDFVTDVLFELNKQGLEGWTLAEWETFIRSREYHVSETSCESDPNSIRPHTQEETCQAITGQNPDNFGEGSIQALQSMAWVTRFSWWTTSRPAVGTIGLDREYGGNINYANCTCTLEPTHAPRL